MDTNHLRDMYIRKARRESELADKYRRLMEYHLKESARAMKEADR